ncbi:MAG: hypothetical protein CMK83_11290 [Pseudomonadales bacterium]|jgi:2-alkyl-3-oxoalkanoate reductase|nr:hypothetical protein [Pseudomonadales bacterium]TNC90963.1 MAG: hypothetical protein CSH49_00550 [Alcanivorax sp.]HAG97063.1 hypothetical protein [Gammaproteobacteria bacterium]MAQ24791.1 hypothetical protein [Pseudomonadales bacterium]HAU12215.1 hypothetical protein [Gammaproteobacteria bacterium]|tara:strand:+ start:38322 stop:39341 length:1020 start_codon:yes stop_codon:yes gene_type:complete
MRQILITGSFGFVGSRLAAHFLRAGCQVRLLDLPNHPHKQVQLAWLREFGDPGLIETDICDAGRVTDAVRGCDDVIHVAALLNSIAPYQQFHRVNVLGTQTVCQACLSVQSAPHLTLVSTSDVFGIPRPGEVITEDSPFRTWDEPYADTKIEAARHVRMLRSEGKLSASIVYPGWVYGPGDRQFFPAVIDMVKSGVVFTWHRSAALEIYLIHIDDLIAGVQKIMDHRHQPCQDFLILDSQTGMTTVDLYNEIAHYYAKTIKQVHLPYNLMMTLAKATQTLARYRLLPAPLLSTTDVKAFGNEFRFSTERAARLLDWRPAVEPRQGISEALQWQSNNFPR